MKMDKRCLVRGPVTTAALQGLTRSWLMWRDTWASEPEPCGPSRSLARLAVHPCCGLAGGATRGEIGGRRKDNHQRPGDSVRTGRLGGCGASDRAVLEAVSDPVKHGADSAPAPVLGRSCEKAKSVGRGPPNTRRAPLTLKLVQVRRGVDCGQRSDSAADEGADHPCWDKHFWHVGANSKEHLCALGPVSLVAEQPTADAQVSHGPVDTPVRSCFSANAPTRPAMWPGFGARPLCRRVDQPRVGQDRDTARTIPGFQLCGSGSQWLWPLFIALPHPPKRLSAKSPAEMSYGFRPIETCASAPFVDRCAVMRNTSADGET